MKKNIYLDTILPQVPRLLGLIDRDSFSPTYGCGDRNYWHYKLIDTPSARFQEVSLTLALLFTINDKKNPYFHQTKIKEWSLAAINYWQKIQKKNGSFDEWYPNEDSFVATTFSLYAVTESLLLLKEGSKAYIQSIQKAADWLLKQSEFTACNQHAGSCIALWNCFELTKDEKYKNGAEEKWQVLKNHQSSEGWFAEYNGADIGYSSVLVDYLGKFYQKSKNQEVVFAMEKLCHFLAFCIHPNFSTGGEYGSRNTEYALPDGFEIFSNKIPEAGFLAKVNLKFLNSNFLNLDDRYLINNGYTFLQAFQDFNLHKLNRSPKKGVFYFPKSGLFVASNPKYYFIANLKKGGVRKIYNQQTRQLVHEHAGVVAEVINGKQYSSQYLNHQTLIKINKKRNIITIFSPLFAINRIQMTSLTLLSSRIFQHTIGRSTTLSKWAKSKLRNLLITGAKPSRLFFKQLFLFSENKVVIQSSLYNPEKLNVKIVRTNDKFSLIYIPSSRYFQLQELESQKMINIDLKRMLRKNQHIWLENIKFNSTSN